MGNAVGRFVFGLDGEVIWKATPCHLGSHTQAPALFAEHFCGVAWVGVRMLCSKKLLSLMFITSSFLLAKKKLLQFDGEHFGYRTSCFQKDECAQHRTI